MPAHLSECPGVGGILIRGRRATAQRLDRNGVVVALRSTQFRALTQRSDDDALLHFDSEIDDQDKQSVGSA